VSCFIPAEAALQVKAVPLPTAPPLRSRSTKQCSSCARGADPGNKSQQIPYKACLDTCITKMIRHISILGPIPSSSLTSVNLNSWKYRRDIPHSVLRRHPNTMDTNACTLCMFHIFNGVRGPRENGYAPHVPMQLSDPRFI
jgi:hypothetical protein